jgi:hypothetical protein
MKTTTSTTQVPAGSQITFVVDDTSTVVEGQTLICPDIGHYTVKSITTTGIVAINAGVSGDVLSGTQIPKGSTLAPSAYPSFPAIVGGVIVNTSPASYIIQVSNAVLFCGTSSGAINIQLLSSPPDGASCFIFDYTGNAATNNITVGAGGGVHIYPPGGPASSSTITLNQNFVSILLVFSTILGNWLPVSYVV